MDWSSLERVDCILHELFQEVQLTLQDGELSDLPSPDVLWNDDKILCDFVVIEIVEHIADIVLSLLTNPSKDRKIIKKRISR
jgi:hypothetical protein